MLIKQFSTMIADYAAEIGCDGAGRIGSHNLPSSVTVRCEGPDDIGDFELASVDLDFLPGCGCPRGIVLVIRKVADS